MFFGDEVRDYNFYYYAAIGNTLLFLGLYHFSHYALVLISDSYVGLPATKQIDWCMRIISSLHAALCSVVSLCVLLYDENLKNNLLRGVGHDGLMLCSISCGYMIADLMVIIYNYRRIGEPIYIVHHVATILPFYFCLCMRLYLYIAMIRLFAELSTICVNLRVLLHDCGLKWGTAYFINGLAMLFTFTVARIIPMPYSYYALYLSQEAPMTYWHAPFIIIIGLTLDTLNLYWYRKMVLGSMKILRKRDSSVSESAQQNVQAGIDSNKTD